MKLCLLVSRRCNLRCDFCRVEFTGQDMSLSTAFKGVELYRGWLPRDRTPRVKFFGGEPLLNFGLIHEVVEAGRGRWAGAGMRFELATNGSYLDAEKIRYFAARPEVEVTISQPAAGATAIPGLWFTVVLDQNGRPEHVVARMRELLEMGYRRFNFLPAYYVPWTSAQLADLRLSFEALRRLFQGLWRRGVGVEVKNFDLWSPVPLYNDAITVDVDGSLYGSNMVQCEGMDKNKARLLLGSVEDAPRVWTSLPDGLLEDILRDWAGSESWETTRRVDALLTDFVRALRPLAPSASGRLHEPA